MIVSKNDYVLECVHESWNKANMHLLVCTYVCIHGLQHKSEWEIRQREEEIAELQKALSDMQVNMYMYMCTCNVCVIPRFKPRAC